MKHFDFLSELQKIYIACNFAMSDLKPLPESQDYAAAQFCLNDKKVQFRVAKITPTKIGQFVTFWKRSDSGPIIPYDFADDFDFLVVFVEHDNLKGQFIFPKLVLLEQGYISKNEIGGKRAMRVYPVWDKPDSKQAMKTQNWQLKYFVEIHEPNLNIQKIQNLLC